jgi:hypothetical protein
MWICSLRGVNGTMHFHTKEEEMENLKREEEIGN